jgi:hypothetical protein
MDRDPPFQLRLADHLRWRKWPPESTDPPTRSPTPMPITESGREWWQGPAGTTKSGRAAQGAGSIASSSPPPHAACLAAARFGSRRHGRNHVEAPPTSYPGQPPRARPGSPVTGAQPAPPPTGEDCGANPRSPLRVLRERETRCRRGPDLCRARAPAAARKTAERGEVGRQRLGFPPEPPGEEGDAGAY